MMDMNIALGHPMMMRMPQVEFQNREVIMVDTQMRQFPVFASGNVGFRRKACSRLFMVVFRFGVVVIGFLFQRHSPQESKERTFHYALAEALPQA